MVERGDVGACVVGGAEAGVTPLAIAAFDGMGATSKIGISRPFDRRRDGFVMGEGAGVWCSRTAGRRRARREVLGRLTGYGATADAFHLTAPDPEGDGAARAIERGARRRQVEPGEVDYVNAHGTSTPLNDRSETEAIKRVVRRARATDPGLLDEVVDRPPARRRRRGRGGRDGRGAAPRGRAADGQPRAARRGLDLDYVPRRGAPARAATAAPLVAISNSFGFGGHNAVLCLEAPA